MTENLSAEFANLGVDLNVLVDNIIDSRFGNIVHRPTAAAQKTIPHTYAALGGGSCPDNLF